MRTIRKLWLAGTTYVVLSLIIAAAFIMWCNFLGAVFYYFEDAVTHTRSEYFRGFLTPGLFQIAIGFIAQGVTSLIIFIYEVFTRLNKAPKE